MELFENKFFKMSEGAFGHFGTYVWENQETFKGTFCGSLANPLSAVIVLRAFGIFGVICEYFSVLLSSILGISLETIQ